jgi:dihydroflavonol-4-reductase
VARLGPRPSTRGASQLRVYVTGATGFVGSHVARELREQGADVRDERVDLLDASGLERAVAGCEAVVHVAALYSYDADPRRVERVNVEGTRTLLDACAREGVRRIVHTSTAGTCGPVPGRQATEEDAPPVWELAVVYKRTKLEAERLALAAGAVVVNPTTPVGDGDRKPTPTGRMIAGVARGRIRGFVATTGLNVVDVRDVARGHALALERGRPGERYLLGGVDLPLAELFAAIADLAGRPRPRIRVPYAVALAAGRAGIVNTDEVRLARLPMYFSSKKAENLLGYAPGPVEPALARAVADAVGKNEKGGA